MFCLSLPQMSPEILIALDFFQKWNKSEHGVTGGAEGEAGPAPGTEDSDCGVAVGPAWVVKLVVTRQLSISSFLHFPRMLTLSRVEVLIRSFRRFEVSKWFHRFLIFYRNQWQDPLPVRSGIHVVWVTGKCRLKEQGLCWAIKCVVVMGYGAVCCCVWWNQ